MAVAADSREHAEQVAVRCSAVAKNIAKKGARVRAISTVLRLGAATVGLAAVVVTYVPDIKTLTGTFGPYVSLAAALILVLGSVLAIVDSTSPKSSALSA